ncbi:MAG: iron hydrogenase small subunit, partial [Symbiobacteriaceae bacterium]|nr:iron hydrogenase small subunit [Symbiobacteriaceae bacterium]
GGCVGGGGQPIREGTVTPPILSPLLYNLDAKATQRYSHHNKAVNLSYAEYLEHPLSSKAMQLLHVHKRG